VNIIRDVCPQPCLSLYLLLLNTQEGSGKLYAINLDQQSTVPSLSISGCLRCNRCTVFAMPHQMPIATPCTNLAMKMALEACSYGYDGSLPDLSTTSPAVSTRWIPASTLCSSIEPCQCVQPDNRIIIRGSDSTRTFMIKSCVPPCAQGSHYNPIACSYEWSS
jgi:hypothetical protein